MYFTPDGRSAIVVAERRERLDFRDPHTFALRRSVRVDCLGIDHLDFSADGSYLIASCEFAGRLVKIDLPEWPHRRVSRPRRVPARRTSSSSPRGRSSTSPTCCGGVHLIDGASFREVEMVDTETIDLTTVGGRRCADHGSRAAHVVLPPRWPSGRRREVHVVRIVDRDVQHDVLSIGVSELPRLFIVKVRMSHAGTTCCGRAPARMTSTARWSGQCTDEHVSDIKQ